MTILLLFNWLLFNLKKKTKKTRILKLMNKYFTSSSFFLPLTKEHAKLILITHSNPYFHHLVYSKKAYSPNSESQNTKEQWWLLLVSDNLIILNRFQSSKQMYILKKTLSAQMLTSRDGPDWMWGRVVMMWC